MDVFSQLQLISPDLSNYSKQHGLSRLFQYLLERLIVDRPHDPIEYLHRILQTGYHDVVRVLILGVTTVEVKLMASTLELDMNLVHLTPENMIEYTNASLKEDIRNYSNISQVPVKLWAEIIKNRVEQADCLTRGWLLEGFPQTRGQAFLLLKSGIYPTHIVVMEHGAKTEKVDSSNSKNPSTISNIPVENYVQSDLIVDVFKSASVTRYNTDLETADLLLCAENFVRRKGKEVITPLPRIILFGPVGSGKKTVAFFLAAKYKVVQISFTEILRQAAMKDGPLKQQMDDILSNDEPIEDEFLANVVAERLNQEDCVSRGWVMYDFPANVSQAEHLTQFLEPYQVNKAIFLEVSLNTCVQRFKLKNKSFGSEGSSYSDEEIEEAFTAFQAGIFPLQAFFSRNLADDITFNINAESSIESVFEMVDNVVLGAPKRHLPLQDWWKWPSRNSGVY